MIGIINYIRHDLEGIYTAELLRGSISMLIAVCVDQILNFGAADTYILIVALYGLRPLTGSTLKKRLINIICSLILLQITLIISMYFGHHHLFIPQLIVSTILSATTVYALARIKALSGTIMFMSVFSIVNFGMGTLDHNMEVTLLDLIKASSTGSICVILSVLIIPISGFHWCLLINHCFYHDLAEYATMMCKSQYYENFSNLKPDSKDKILMLQSSLLNTISYVSDPIRKSRYINIIDGLVLITYWPSTGTTEEHIHTINIVRNNIFILIKNLLTSHGKENNTLALKALINYQNTLTGLPRDLFCNGEMIHHAELVLQNIAALKKEILTDENA